MAKNELTNSVPAPVSNVEDELIKLYGPPGGPVKDDLQPVIDALGRVNGQTFPSEIPIEDYPDFLLNAAAKTEGSTKNIKIFKDHTLEYPTLCLKVFVQPDPSVPDDSARFAKMFARAGCRKAEGILDADIVVFGGGSDVDPLLYGELRHELTFPNAKRDDVDMELFLLCKEQGIPMFGVCRGAQFLHVMHGGKLFQDIDGHYGDHSIFDLVNSERIQRVSSVHHQSCRPNTDKGMRILATSAMSETRALNNEIVHAGPYPDIEAFVYRETCSIGVQGHPEYDGYYYYTKWCLDLILLFVSENPDLYWDGPNLRLKKEFIEEQKLLEQPREILTVPSGKKEK